MTSTKKSATKKKTTKRKAAKSVHARTRRDAADGRITFLDPMSDEFAFAMTDAFRKGVREAVQSRGKGKKNK